jgi:type I restriction enzyme S subunit
MKEKVIPSAWLEKDGRRLDCGPYMSGAIEAKLLLEKMTVKKEPLHTLTKGYDGGIYNGPQFVRNYVSDANYGVPFVSSSSMLLADLSRVDLLRKRDALSSKLSHLRIEEGMTLISCSGTIGRMVYARPEMIGMWSSQDVLKVVPDPDKVLPGYIHAFLSSRFGVPLVVGGTYGAIILHIEPEHIAKLPVPRLGLKREEHIHGLVQKAAVLRAEATRSLLAARARFDSYRSPAASGANSPRISFVKSTSICKRMDAAFHDPQITAVIEHIASGEHTTIGEFCDQVFLPGIFKRIHVEELKYGAPYYLGASLFWLEPLPKGILGRRTTLFDDVLLNAGTILVQAFGQDGGLIGRLAWVGDHLDRVTTTHMLVRLRARDESLSGWLWAFLDSDAGYSLLRRLPYGGSIPHLDETAMRGVLLPLAGEAEMRALSADVLRALSQRDEAVDIERSARRLVEEAIEGVA